MPRLLCAMFPTHATCRRRFNACFYEDMNKTFYLTHRNYRRSVFIMLSMYFRISSSDSLTFYIYHVYACVCLCRGHITVSYMNSPKVSRKEIQVVSE